MPGSAGTPRVAPFWTRVLGFAADNGRFASNNAAGSRQWQRAGLLVTSRHGDDSPPERASGQQLDALAWAVARQRRQAGQQGMPARCPLRRRRGSPTMLVTPSCAAFAGSGPTSSSLRRQPTYFPGSSPLLPR